MMNISNNLLCRFTIASLVNNSSVQQGIVLPVALVLIVILSIFGILSMRNATIGDQTVNNLRGNAVAQQAAEAGLRYCELLALESEQKKDGSLPTTGALFTDADYAKISSPTTKITSADDPVALWRNKTNWIDGAANLILVKNGVYKTTTVEVGQLKYPPKCIIEEMVPSGSIGANGYLITARGIANDSIYDGSTGVVKSGTEIVLQSVISKDES